MKIPAKILIAEDDQTTALSLQKALLNGGYQVASIAQTAKEAIRKADKFKPDLILMDINFENQMLDGIEAAASIQEKLEIPIIYLTGSADNETFERAKLTGPYSYLLKPVDVEKLRISIEIALHNSALEKELRKKEREVARSFIRGQDQEKIRIEEELHEGMGVRLANLRYFISILEEKIEAKNTAAHEALNELSAMVEEARSELVRITFELVPNVLMNFGFIAAILTLKKKLETESDKKIYINFAENEEERLEHNVEIGAYWLIFETLHNFVKLAKAKEISVSVEKQPQNQVLLIIFESRQQNPSILELMEVGNPVGLHSLEARIKSLHGKYAVVTDEKNALQLRTGALTMEIPYNI